MGKPKASRKKQKKQDKQKSCMKKCKTRCVAKRNKKQRGGTGGTGGTDPVPETNGDPNAINANPGTSDTNTDKAELEGLKKEVNALAVKVDKAIANTGQSNADKAIANTGQSNADNADKNTWSSWWRGRK